jgi:hypothetical protein
MNQPISTFKIYVLPYVDASVLHAFSADSARSADTNELYVFSANECSEVSQAIGSDIAEWDPDISSNVSVYIVRNV